MIIPGHVAKEKGFVREMVSDAQVQPCGIDLTLREVYSFAGAGRIDFDNKERKISGARKLAFRNEWMNLKKGTYKIVYNEVVRVPRECAGLAFPRSSLLRCGADVHCAVWDPGYEGRSESLLVVENARGIKLKRNARLVQIIFVKLAGEARKVYSGRYAKENMRA